MACSIILCQKLRLASIVAYFNFKISMKMAMNMFKFFLKLGYNAAQDNI